MTNIKKNALVLTILLIVFSCTFILLANRTAFAESSNANKEPQPTRWAQVASHCSENYSILDNELNYCSSNSSVAYNYVEVIGHATDNYSTESLTHFSSLGAAMASNRCSNGPVTITFSNLIPTTGPYRISNDTCKMKSLTSELSISGDNTKVGYGKIKVKTLKDDGYSNWTSWSYYNLEDASTLSLSFNVGYRVVIIVLYELKEPANLLVHHHVRVNYGFRVTNIV